MTRGIRLAAFLFALSAMGCFEGIALEPSELGFGGGAGDGRGKAGLGGFGGDAGMGGVAGEGGVAGTAGTGGDAGALGVGGTAGEPGVGGAAGAAAGGAGGMVGTGGTAGTPWETGPDTCAELCTDFLDWRIAELQCLSFAFSLTGLPAADGRSCNNVRDARSCERCLSSLGVPDRVCEAAALICGF